MNADEANETIKAHAEWLSSCGKTGKQLIAKGLSFKGIDLSGVDLSECALAEADFSESVLSHAICVKSHLVDCMFHHAQMEGANFSKATLDGSDLRNANLRQHANRHALTISHQGFRVNY